MLKPTTHETKKKEQEKELTRLPSYLLYIDAVSEERNLMLNVNEKWGNFCLIEKYADKRNVQPCFVL